MIGIFTSDDVGTSSAPRSFEAFNTVTAWLESRGLRATFFWVPKAGDDPEALHRAWLPTLEATEAKGHDFQLHGLTHSTCLEFGLTQESTRRSNPKPFEEYERNREHWEREHSVASLTAKLQEASEIYERVLGRRPLVFRAPCFGMCPNAYTALHNVGIVHSSSRGLNPTATAYTITKDRSLRHWSPDYACHPRVEPPGVTEYVAIEDLTIRGVPVEEYEDRLDLFRSELSHFFAESREDSVLVLCTHFNAMYATWDQTRRLFDELLDWLAGEGVREWRTFTEYISWQPVRASAGACPP